MSFWNTITSYLPELPKKNTPKLPPTPTKKSMEFPVGEGLTPKQTKTANAIIAKPDSAMQNAQNNSFWGLTKGTIKEIPNTIATAFKTRKEPVPLRPLFAKEETNTTLPPIVTGLSKFGTDVIESVPRFAATLYGETIAPDKDTGEVDIGIDARRLGYEGEKYPTTSKELQTKLDEGENPWIAALDVGSNKVLDVAFGASVVAGALKSSIARMLKGGVQSRIEAQATLDAFTKNQKNIFESTKNLPLAQREKALADLANARKTAEEVIAKSGAPTAIDTAKSATAKVLEPLGRETSIKKGFWSDFMKPNLGPKPNALDPNVVISGQLPGYRDVPGQPFPMGLSTKQVEGVGFTTPAKIETAAQNRYGKSFADLSKSEAKVLAGTEGGAVVPATDVIAATKKFATPTFGKSVFEMKPELLYAGIKEGVFTDSFQLIADKEAATKLLEDVLAKKKASEIKLLTKQGMPHAEASAIVEKKVQENLSNPGQFPDWKQIVPKEIPKQAPEFLGVDFANRSGEPSMVYRNGEDHYAYASDYLANLQKALPGRDIRIDPARGMMMFVKDGKIDGLLMPLNGDTNLAEKFAGVNNKPKPPHLKFDDTGRKIAYTAKQQAIVDREIGPGDRFPKKIQTPVSKTTLPAPKAQSITKKPTSQVQVDKVQIPQSIKEEKKAIVSYEDSLTQSFNTQQEAVKAFEDFGEVPPDPLEFPTQVQEVRKLAKDIGLKDKSPYYKDIGIIKMQNRDIFRNTEQVFGKDFPAIKRDILDPFDASKGEYIDALNNTLDRLSKDVVDKFKFKRGSVESKYIQQFGEKKISLQDLIKKVGEPKALNIVEADKWFRNEYDSLMERVNQVEKEIYPNNPEKWTPKRKDYYRHFSDLSSDFSRLQNILNNPARIDPMLVGISEGTKPKSKWASFKQQRLGIKTKEDAIGGFLDYLPSAEYAIHIDPNIGKFRELAETLARQTRKTKNINNYINELQKFANELSGKTNELDRIITEHVPGGRTTLQVVDWVNKRVKANTILFNLRSSISQIFNVPQGIASAGPLNSAKAIARTVSQNFIPNKEMAKSVFLKERYFKGFNRFEHGFLNNSKKFAIWMVNALDEAGTKFIWNGQYEKALQKRVLDPVKYADDATRKLVAGRGIGEKPLVQNSKVFQMIAPFQLEVGNLWWAMEDLAKGDEKIMKKFGQFASLFVSLYLLNEGAEKITGNRVALDPIQMMKEAIDRIRQEPNKAGFAKAGGRIAGEVLSNIPFGQTVASTLPMTDAQKKQYFGKADPTRFGGGLIVTKALKDPLYKILPPFGGGQVKKTVEGIQSIREGGSFNKGNNLQFVQGQSDLEKAQTILFGKYAGEQAQEYFNKADDNKKEEARVMPVYKQVQELVAQDKIEEATAITEAMSPEDYAVYKRIKTNEATAKTMEGKKRILPVYLEVQKLLKEGKTEEATEITQNMSEEDYRYYSLIKKQLQK
jgi:hypothetical protein